MIGGVRMRDKQKLFAGLGRILMLIWLCIGGIAMALGREEMAAGQPLAYAQTAFRIYWNGSPFILALYLLCDYRVMQKKRWGVWVLSALWLVGEILYLLIRFL